MTGRKHMPPRVVLVSRLPLGFARGSAGANAAGDEPFGDAEAAARVAQRDAIHVTVEDQRPGGDVGMYELTGAGGVASECRDIHLAEDVAALLR